MDARRVLEENEVDALFRGLQLYTEERKRQRRHSRTKAAKQYLPDLDGRVYVDHVAPFVLSVYYGGFRPGDLFSLQWQHFSDGFAHITKVLSKTAHHGRHVQRFPLSAPLIKVIKTWWKEQGCPRRATFSRHRVSHAGSGGCRRARYGCPGERSNSWAVCRQSWIFIPCVTTSRPSW